MPSKVAITTLNASTIDIINTIRANASYEYQSLVPSIETTNDIPKVGEILFGYPALANQFLNALINRIALVRVKSATFNNDYKELKKGYLEFGETVEEVFVSIAKAREFSVEKAPAREFKRTIPDVRSAFHAMNWRVQYPITVQNEDLRLAFQSINGVQDLITKIVDSVYTANEYDEYLLFKYLMIKAISHGKMYPVAFDPSDMKNAAKKFRGMSNQLQFMSNKYNAYGVTTTTPKADQFIFMDAQFNAGYDVDVLASAFNMDKATFSGKLKLIDDWTTFDNDRFNEIRANGNQIEEVTAQELALMADVKAVLVDREWFQIYDNLNLMTEQNVASGIYWNYFYNVWKTVSSSPFSNAIVFVANTATTNARDAFDIVVADKSIGNGATVLSLIPDTGAGLIPSNVTFIQTANATENGIAIHKYGAIIIPDSETVTGTVIKCMVDGIEYTSATAGNNDTYTKAEVGTSNNVGDTVLFVKSSLISD